MKFSHYRSMVVLSHLPHRPSFCLLRHLRPNLPQIPNSPLPPPHQILLLPNLTLLQQQPSTKRNILRQTARTTTNPSQTRSSRTSWRTCSTSSGRGATATPPHWCATPGIA
ncbi:hypothetical protein GLYMA_10G106301v4 [Glycine max]|nr:hypothetical protein GLYMA_10G106301v4 [Glycine max]